MSWIVYGLAVPPALPVQSACLFPGRFLLDLFPLLAVHAASMPATTPLASHPACRSSSTAHVCLLQSGAGHLSPAPRQDADLTAALAFAASVHMERQQLRMRVADLPAGMDPHTAAACVLTEMACGGGWAAAGYTDGPAKPTRYSPCITPNDAAVYQPVPPSARLGRSDVVLVTGGAKGERQLPAKLSWAAEGGQHA